MRVSKAAGIAAVIGFLGCVVLANYAIDHWGTLAFPGGPHTVTLLGLTAPSGVLFVGLSFTLRDLAQMSLGRAPVLIAILLGAGLSAIVASPALALGSGVAFLLGESGDFFVYTPLAERGRWFSGVAASNIVGSAIDSLAFLWIAFGWVGVQDFLKGQFVLKAIMTVPALLVLAPWRLAQRRVAHT